MCAGKTPSFSVILVEPEFEINLGSVARAMANFGFQNLILVNPKCKLGKTAFMFAKAGQPILQNAKIVRTFDDALKAGKFDLAIGTTSAVYRFRKDLNDPIPLRKLKLPKNSMVALVFGRESVGLRREEAAKCDILVTVETHQETPALNLSHAVAIVLYQLSGIRLTAYEPAKAREKKKLLETFALLISMLGVIKKPKKMQLAFKRLLSRALASKEEAECVNGVLRFAIKKIWKLEKSRAIGEHS